MLRSILHLFRLDFYLLLFSLPGTCCDFCISCSVVNYQELLKVYHRVVVEAVVVEAVVVEA